MQGPTTELGEYGLQVFYMYLRLLHAPTLKQEVLIAPRFLQIVTRSYVSGKALPRRHRTFANTLDALR